MILSLRVLISININEWNTPAKVKKSLIFVLQSAFWSIFSCSGSVYSFISVFITLEMLAKVVEPVLDVESQYMAGTRWTALKDVSPLNTKFDYGKGTPAVNLNACQTWAGTCVTCEELLSDEEQYRTVHFTLALNHRTVRVVHSSLLFHRSRSDSRGQPVRCQLLLTFIYGY